MLQKNESPPRVWRSALALKTYFERRLGKTLELLTEAPTLAVNGDIPLGPGFKAHGIWGLRPHGPLSIDAIDEIATTFGEVLGGAPARSSDAAKVVSFQAPAASKAQAQGDFLIECASSEEMYKMAFELHSSSGRYAFLSFSDLEPVSRNYVADLIALGTLTLFVPDAGELTFDEQETLLKLISVRSVERPLVMVGTADSLVKVRARSGMNLAFLAQISKVHLKMTKTFGEYKRQGMLQYFLDSFSADRK